MVEFVLIFIKMIMRNLVGFVLGGQKRDPYLGSPGPKLYLAHRTCFFLPPVLFLNKDFPFMNCAYNV